jgi:nicotinate-nucleotide adenylyltransferase
MTAERIGIGGGIFDPVHYGHLLLFNECAEQLDLSRVLLIPAYSAVHKMQSAISDYVYRRSMVEIVSEGNERFELCEIEREFGGPSYTIDTVRALKDRYSHAEFFFLVGLDNLEKMENWHKPDDILDEVNVVVGSRPVESLSQSPLYSGRVSFIEIPLLEISSTHIRERVRHGRSIKYLVPEQIERYIRDHGLYR